MSGFISALIKQRKDAKKAQPDTNGRLREIIAIIRKQNYEDGITPEVLVQILEDLGPTYVKIGQIASQQAEYIPAKYCDALAGLRSKVAPMDIATVREQIEKYLGKPVEELYATFDEKPLGSASIAQVHRATLFDGTVVAVKVRRPGIVDTVARDFALIEKVLDTFAKNGVGGIDIKSFIVELENTSKSELDLTNEANNLDRFWNNNLGREKVESPKCYRELTCEAVLTESFVTGTEVSDTDHLDTLSGEERERLAALVADNFAMQVLTDGFYHADPHSGNVLIKETAAVQAAAADEDPAEAPAERKTPLPEHSIEWIDFGMMGTLTSKQRQILIDIVSNVVMKDAYGLKRAVLQVAQPQGEINHGALLEMCEGMCGQFNGGDFGDFDLGDLMGTILGGLQEENYKIDPFITNLARGIVAVEGTVKALSPKVNILNYFMDKVGGGFDFNLNLEHPEEMNPQIAMKLIQLANGLTDSAVKKADALDMLEKGQIKVHTEFSFEDSALKNIKRMIRYIIEGILVVALFIGSTTLCTVAPLENSGPFDAIALRTIGVTGYFICVYAGIHLVRKMKKDE
ncbi:MAG: AarF/ABC1/UbiB kinase family protein [Clostridia bacterium]|nr:AarF/ABC1/UbiB kinase family protein [Clostridia bacterium]